MRFSSLRGLSGRLFAHARTAVLAAFASLLLCSGAVSAEESSAYVVGVVPQFEQRKLFSIWTPILKELEQRTGLSFELAGNPKISVFEERFQNGEFDFVYLNPYHMLMAFDAQGYQPLVRDGERRLKGILVTAKDSGIESVAELEGQEIVFPSPNALGASLLMRAELTRKFGLNFEPRYVKTHTSAYLYAATGVAPAGGGVMGTLKTQTPEIRDRLKVIHTTRAIAPHPIAAHPRVRPGDAEKVQAALLAMADDPRSAALLLQIPIGTPAAATMADYEPLRELGLEAFVGQGD